MLGKRAATPKLKESSASQLSILSFFGKGSAAAAAATDDTRETKCKDDWKMPRKVEGPNEGAAARAGSSDVDATCTPAAKRRKQAGAADAAAATFDLVEGTAGVPVSATSPPALPTEIGSSARTRTPAAGVLAAALAATATDAAPKAPRGSPPRVLVPDDPVRERDASRASAGAVVSDASSPRGATGTMNTEAEAVAQPTGHGDDAPSPGTHGESSPPPPPATAPRRKWSEGEGAAVGVAATKMPARRSRGIGGGGGGDCGGNGGGGLPSADGGKADQPAAARERAEKHGRRGCSDQQPEEVTDETPVLSSGGCDPRGRKGGGASRARGASGASGASGAREASETSETGEAREATEATDEDGGGNGNSSDEVGLGDTGAGAGAGAGGGRRTDEGVGNVGRQEEGEGGKKGEEGPEDKAEDKAEDNGETQEKEKDKNIEDGETSQGEEEGEQRQPPPPPPPPQQQQQQLQQADDGGMSEYELKRLERIKRNQAFMATLGLATVGPTAPSLAGVATSSGVTRGSNGCNKKRSRPVSRVKERAPAVPVRRSTRARGAEAVDYNEDKQAMSFIAAAAREAAARAQEPEPVLEEAEFDDSTVLKYLCGGGGGAGDGSASAATGGARNTRGGGGGSAETVPKGARVVGLLARDHPLSASGLSTIYTMHFCGAGDGGRAPPLLAAGGKGGVVALFSTQQRQQRRSVTRGGDASDEEEHEGERTLMNFKAHNGWVSAVRFLDSGGGESGSAGVVGGAGCRLLSSANDSVVKLWDTSKQHRGLPRLLCIVNDLHPTRKGIFSMDSCGARVATGSKDTTVALGSVRPTGLECDRVLGEPGGSKMFHEKVVKGVSLRDESTVASCGDDSNVRVSDLRSSSPFGVSHWLDGAHDGPCHTVRWHPVDANLLLSAGLDSAVKLHDLRRLGPPLHVYRGHCPYKLARPRSIHRPEFLFPAAVGAGDKGGSDDGAPHANVNIITCGERSDKLSMYDAGTGATVSRGLLGAEASALAVGGGDWSTASQGVGVVAAALPGGSVVLLEPVWRSG